MMRLLLIVTVAAACSCYATSEVHPDLDGGGGGDGDGDGDASPNDDADDHQTETDPPDADEEEARPPITDRRILVIIDQSASVQCTDPGLLRNELLSELVDRERGSPNVSMGYIGFHADIFAHEFVQIDELLADSVDDRLQIGPASDYQGALTAAYDMLEESMEGTPSAWLERTGYEIHFFSDGTPEPRCDAGCEDDTIYCSDGVDNDGDGVSDEDDSDCVDTYPDDLYPAICNDTVDLGDYGGQSYVDRGPRCSAYNTDDQILEKVQAIRVLGDRYGVGEVTLSTIFLYTAPDVVNARCGRCAANFGYEWIETEARLRAMAEAGGGVFDDPYVEIWGTRELTDPDACSDEPLSGPAYECDDRTGECGNPEQSGGGWWRSCWLEPDICEEICGTYGGEFFLFDDVTLCACPEPYLSGPYACSIDDESPQGLCQRPSGAWSDDGDGGHCTCHPDYLYVLEGQYCANRESLIERCDESGGSWVEAEDRCECPPQSIYLHEYSGCVFPTDVGTVCIATGGTWLETTEWWTCFCPDGRSMMNGNCL